MNDCKGRSMGLQDTSIVEYNVGVRRQLLENVESKNKGKKSKSLGLIGPKICIYNNAIDVGIQRENV